MKFLAIDRLTGNWTPRSETYTRARTYFANPDAEHTRISVSGVLALLTILLTGHFAGAQTNASPSRYLKRGLERYNAGDFDEAIADFSEAIDINSGFKPSERRRNRSHFKADQEVDRVDEGRIFVIDPFNAVAYYDRGMAWLGKGELDRAIDDFNKAIGSNPSYIDAYLVRGRAWHSKKNLTRAIADYGRAIALDPRCTFAYNNRGIARKDLQDLPGAISDFDRAIILNPALIESYINRGAARCAIGDLTGARADLDKAIAVEPRNGKAYNNRGTVRQAVGDYDGALADYNQAILLDPEYALAYVNRGLILLERDNISGAEADFMRALALAPALRPDIERFLLGGGHPSKKLNPPAANQ